MNARAPSDTERVIATNRRARHDYHIEQTFECGVSLVGSEVKTLRQGKASLAEAYAQVRNGEVFLYGANIPRYAQASMQNHDPERARKLLRHRFETDRVRARIAQQGPTLVPLRLISKGNQAKGEPALGLRLRIRQHSDLPSPATPLPQFFIEQIPIREREPSRSSTPTGMRNHARSEPMLSRFGPLPKGGSCSATDGCTLRHAIARVHQNSSAV